MPLPPAKTTMLPITSNSAVTFMSDVISISVLVAVITPSDQPTKAYPLFGTAVTAVPLSPARTLCSVVPSMVPPSPAK